MQQILVRKLRKVTLKTLPLYILGLLALLTAQPRLDFLGAGLLFVMLGEGVRIWAAGHLQKNEELTTTGPYAYVKNPLYLGTFLLIVGFSLMMNHLLILALGVGVFLFYYVPYKRRRESERLAQRFGQRWQAYEALVPDYWPRLSPYEHRGDDRWSIHRMINNSEHETLLTVLLGIVVIILKAFVEN